MADQQRWFKLWESALSDDHLQALSPALRWAWVAFGAYTKVHGTKGRIAITPTNQALEILMGIPQGTLIDTLKMFPHMSIEEGKKRHAEYRVTWHNWVKYQRDSTQAQRAAASRSKRRGEERRGEEKTPPLSPPPGGSSDGFEFFWSVYPRRVGKGAAEKAWNRLHPTNGQREAIVAAVKAQIGGEQWRKNNGQFIPHPATWLNQRRWEDDKPEASVPTETRHGCRDCGWDLGHAPSCRRA